jgi:hypothetical protein
MVKEEFWSEARWLEGHREEVAMRASVRLVAVNFEISKENRPKPVTASIDQAPRKKFSDYAKALFLDLDDFVLNYYQFTMPRGPPVWQTSPSRTSARNTTRKAPPGFRVASLWRISKPGMASAVIRTGTRRKRRALHVHVPRCLGGCETIAYFIV